MARKIFYHRRSRRRVIAVAGFAVSALHFFSAGVYTGISWAPLFSTSQFAVANEPQATLAAAEF